MGTSITISQTEFDHNLQQLKPSADKVSAKITDCKRTASKVPTLSPGELVLGAVFPIAGIVFGVQEIQALINTNPAVKKKLDEAETTVARVLVEIGKLLSPGNPFAMIAAEGHWEEVKRQLTGIVAPLGGDQFRATHSWTDSMGQLYAVLPTQQLAALKGLTPHVESMATFMAAHSGQIIKLWGDVVKEITNFQIEAIPLAAKFIQANPLKWLELAESIAECIAAVLRAIEAIAILIVNFTAKTLTQIQTVLDAMSDVTGTDYGKWPTANLG